MKRKPWSQYTIRKRVIWWLASSIIISTILICIVSILTFEAPWLWDVWPDTRDLLIGLFGRLILIAIFASTMAWFRSGLFADIMVVIPVFMPMARTPMIEINLLIAGLFSFLILLVYLICRGVWFWVNKLYPRS